MALIKIDEGGEGSIFLHPTDSNLVIKTYHKPNLRVSQKLIDELKPLSNFFIKPAELFYDNKNPIGFVMPYLNTKVMKLLYSLLSVSNPMSIDEKTKVLENLKQRIKECHSLGIVIGDLNPTNIYVATNLNVYFIDVDSFQTKSFAHSLTIMPEYRDFLSPIVNENTDWYAYAVIAFELFSYVHPYKGISKLYSSLGQRAVNKHSILNTEVKKPKCFVQITSNLISQFSDIFDKGLRFEISFQEKVQVVSKTYTTVIGSLKTKDISNVHVKNKRILLGDLVLKDGEFLSNDFFTYEKNNFLYAYDDKNLFSIPVYKEALRKSHNVYLYLKSILYPTQNGFVSIVSNYNILSCYKVGNLFMIEVIDNEIKYYICKEQYGKLVKIFETNSFKFFTTNDSVIFIPFDNKLLVYDMNFSLLKEFECSFIEDSSKLEFTIEGILCKNNNTKLLNV